MAPKGRAIRKGTHIDPIAQPTVTTTPEVTGRATSATSGTTRKTRASAAAAAGVDTIPGVGGSQQPAGKDATPKTHKRDISDAAAMEPTSSKKVKKSDIAPLQMDTAPPKKVSQRRPALGLRPPPIEFTSSGEEDVALAVTTRSRGKRPATHPDPASAEEDNDEPITDAENAVDEFEGDGVGQDNDDGEEVSCSSESDGLASEEESLGAQLAAEKAVWTGKPGTSAHTANAPMRFEDIGVPGSVRGQAFRDMSLEDSSPGSSDSEFQPEEESDNSGAIPPLLPPTTAPSEKPSWKAPADNGTQASNSTMVLSAQRQLTAGGNDDDSDSESDTEALILLNPPNPPHPPNPPPPLAGGPDVQPPASYMIIQPGGHGVVNLTAQHEHTRKVVRDTLPILEARLVFEHAFPDTISLAQDVHETLINVANLSGYAGLEEALRFNHQVSAPVAAIVKQRMSTFRGTIKKTADSHVAAFYSLKPGCGPLVTALFDHLSYNYVFTWDPEAAKLNVTWSKPYGHEIYPAMLHSCFFNSSSSIAAKHPDHFKSSLDQRPEEKEIPIAMLAFVGAAIHAALTEWRSGTQGHTSFSADAYLDVYNEHRLLLAGIKDKNVRAFHKMMHRLYCEASGATPANNNATITAANDALSFVDFAGMDID